jgi:hypothetical protein
MAQHALSHAGVEAIATQANKQRRRGIGPGRMQFKPRRNRLRHGRQHRHQPLLGALADHPQRLPGLRRICHIQ